MKNLWTWLIFLFILFVGSYYREVLFRSVNALIAGEDFFYAKTTHLPFLEGWNRGELLKLKYGLTVGFSVFFMGVSLLGLRLGFHERWPFHILMGIYGMLVVAAGVVAVFGIAFLSFSEVYPILRMFIGWIHSPILYLILSAAYLGTSQYKKS